MRSQWLHYLPHRFLILPCFILSDIRTCWIGLKGNYAGNLMVSVIVAVELTGAILVNHVFGWNAVKRGTVAAAVHCLEHHAWSDGV